MRSLAAIVLLLWTACYAHCSAQQLGLLDGAVSGCQCSPGQEWPDPCPEPDDTDGAPCGLCDYLVSGGAPMVSALALEPVQEWVLETPALDSAELLARQALESDAARMAVARNRRIVAYCDHVYPFLAVRVVPPRGPDA